MTTEHSTEKARLAESRYFQIADGTTWPLPDVDREPVAWKLTYAPDAMTDADRMYAAAIIHAYGHLVIEAKRGKRDLVARSFRQYLKSRFRPGEPDA